MPADPSHADTDGPTFVQPAPLRLHACKVARVAPHAGAATVITCWAFDVAPATGNGWIPAGGRRTGGLPAGRGLVVLACEAGRDVVEVRFGVARGAVVLG